MKKNIPLMISRLIRGYLRKRSLHSYGVGYIAETPYGTYAIDPRDFAISRSLLKFGSYAKEDILFLKDLLSKDSRVCFVGTHIGTLLVPISKGVKSVIGYEANWNNHRLLQYNLLLNKIENAQIFNLAVGEKEGTVRVKHNILNTGNSIIDHSDNKALQEVNIVALDHHLRGVPEYDLVVMDVEGSECAALRGMKDFLKKVKYLFIEYCPDNLAQFGETRESFIQTVSTHYSNMYLFGNTVEKYENNSWKEMLRNLPLTKGLLLNLLFSNDSLPSEALQRKR